MKKIFIITGEISADLHASGIVRYLQKQNPELQIEAIGGPNLQETGIKLFCNHSKMSAAGLNFKILTEHWKLGQELFAYLKNKYKPDLVLLIDYGGFNLKMASAIKKAMPLTKIFYFIPPQIWASRKWRINTVKKYIDKVLYIFPFEKDLYEEHNIPCEFVGHPLVNEIPVRADKKDFFEVNGFDVSKRLISIFPGSRSFEIIMLMPAFIKVAEKLHKMFPDIQFALCQSPAIKENLKKKYNVPDWIKIIPKHNYELLSCSDFLILASGTVALEAAIYTTPMVICYRAPWLFYLIYLLVRCIKRVSLPNIIMDKEIVPELIQLKCSPDIITNSVSQFMTDKHKYDAMKSDLSLVKDKLCAKDYVPEVSKYILDAFNTSPY